MKFLILIAMALPLWARAEVDANIQDRICSIEGMCNHFPEMNWPHPGPGPRPGPRPRPPYPPPPPRRPPPAIFYCYAADNRGMEFAGERAYSLRYAQDSAIDSCQRATRRYCHVTQCYRE